MRPTLQMVALAAARYCAAEFSDMREWFSHEEELARQWLGQNQFVCTANYTIDRVMSMTHNGQMARTAAEHGGGAKGWAEVAGRVVGEWIKGGSTIEQELASW